MYILLEEAADEAISEKLASSTFYNRNNHLTFSPDISGRITQQDLVPEFLYKYKVLPSKTLLPPLRLHRGHHGLVRNDQVLHTFDKLW